MNGEAKVVIRPLEPRDLESLVHWRNQAFDQFFGDDYLTMEGQARWFQGTLADASQRMFVIQTFEGTAIGTIGLVGIDRHHQLAELGRTLVGIDYERRNGYALDAVRLLVTYAFQEMNLHRLSLEVFADNQAAIGLYEAAGFVKEGLLRQAVWKGGRFRDVIIMGILRGEAIDS